jgi:acyl-CoA reductase-like NAD-dependent aldehyde dehydrogenase
MKRLILECGGKAPNIVFEDCPDLEQVAESVLTRAFWNQGQVCTASSRLVAHERLKEPLLSALVAKAAALVPEDPLNPRSKFGALVSQEHKEKVLTYVNTAVREGARIVYRSDVSPPHAGGAYLGPVILDNVSQSARVAQEEIFGPVLSVMTFRDEEEAIEIANNTIYGLSAIAWTKSLARAHRITQRLRAGCITVYGTGKPSGGPGAGVLSIGGHKESGIGTEGGIDGLEAYTISSSVQLFV